MAPSPGRVNIHVLLAAIEVYPYHDPGRFVAGSNRRLYEAWTVIIHAEHVWKKGKHAVTGKVIRACAGGEVNDRVTGIRAVR